ncbi:sensor domain-containing diguanylate cyclase [Deinococcus navajonensis]|uniref:Diguanylate cyclase domain-containing protein n=1 Tax=Deinococcus navajonensis TaxID=309884 RepID=A0ABV8XRP3_9DEIO
MVSAGMPNLRRVAWGVLATIALIGVWSNASLERDTSELQKEVSVMNITDRQRVYAEEVARHAWQLVTALSVEDRKQARTRLKRSVAGMRDGQGAWVQATALNDPQVTAPPLYSRLDVEVQGYLAAANSILLTPDEQLKRRNSDIRWLEQQASGPLISVLDEAITALEDQGEGHIRSMIVAARLRLVCVIALLFGLGQGVFRPLDRRIRRAQAELTAERDFAQTLLAISALVESEFDPAAMAAEVLNLLGPALGMNRSSVLLVRDRHVEVVTAWPPDEPAPGVWEVEGRVHRVADAEHSVTIIDGGAAASGQTSEAWVSLALVEETQFLLAGSRAQPVTSWSSRDRALLSAAARTVRVALERQGRFRQVERAALTDPLTGLGNRRALNRALEELSVRPGEPFGLLSVDVDGLKQVNDTFGHHCGDRLLQEFGRALQDMFREQDLVFRLGGDEFIVLLPGCRQEQAQSMLDRVQAASERVRHQPELMGCGASAGAAFRPDDGPLLAHLVARADERMYEHKRRRKTQPVCEPA